MSVIFDEDGLTVIEVQPEGSATLLEINGNGWLSRAEVERLRDALAEWLRT